MQQKEKTLSLERKKENFDVAIGVNCGVAPFSSWSKFVFNLEMGITRIREPSTIIVSFRGWILVFEHILKSASNPTSSLHLEPWFSNFQILGLHSKPWILSNPTLSNNLLKNASSLWVISWKYLGLWNKNKFVKTWDWRFFYCKNSQNLMCKCSLLLISLQNQNRRLVTKSKTHPTLHKIWYLVLETLNTNPTLNIINPMEVSNIKCIL